MSTDARGRLSFVKSALSVAVAAAFASAPINADAAGLGRLTVQSGLGQPLEAQVEITALTREEASSLTARLAAPEAFNDAGLEFNPALTSLRFEIQQVQGARPIVSIRSLSPINEPFIDLLIELNWSTGKFVREYTFLLDPPELQLGRAAPQELTAPVAPSVGANAALPASDVFRPAVPVSPAESQPAAAAAAASTAAAQAQTVTQAPAAAASPQAASAPGVTRNVPSAPATPTRREVNRGDTLADIAESVRPANVSLNQAIVALYKQNPDAFFGSVHQMRAGAVLTIPTLDTFAATTVGEAREEIARSNQVFREYRARIADQTREATSLANESTTGATAAVGEIAAAAEPIEQTRPIGDQLELSRQEVAPQGAAGAATGDQSAVAEGSIARDIALRNAQDRVSELERNVTDLQRLLELKNQQLADLAGRADAVAAGTDAGLGSEGAGNSPAASEPASNAGDGAEQGVRPVDPAAGDASTAFGGADSETGATTSVSIAPEAAESAAEPTSAAEAGTQADEQSAQAAAQEALAQAAANTEQVRPQQTAVTPQAAPQTGVMGMVNGLKEQALGNPYVPAGIAVLLGLVGLFVWKRRRPAEPESAIEDSLGGDDAFSSNSLFGSTGGQDVDTSNSLFGSVAAESESSVDVHSTEVDPIAEAEVYIAYGREAQAEEILKEALKRQPDRQAIRLKLLEIHAGRKDATTYAHLAREMYDQTGGQNEEWPKVITMGLAIDADNPLYTGEAGSVAPAAPQAPLDRGTEGALDALGEDLAADGQGPESATDSGLDFNSPTSGAGTGLTDDAPATTSPSFDSIDSLNPATGSAEPSLSAADSVVNDLEQALSRSPSDSLDVGTNIDTPTALDSDTFAEVDAELGALDFDLDTKSELGDSDTIADTLSADTGSLDMQGMSFDLNDGDVAQASQTETQTASEVSASVDDMSELGLDIPSIDTLSGVTVPENADVDLSSIGLDLAPTDGSADAPSTNDSARWQEMATKLDLASAYEEIGDREGARELLEEVVKGGDTAQQQKAKAMLSKIS